MKRFFSCHKVVIIAAVATSFLVVLARGETSNRAAEEALSVLQNGWRPITSMQFRVTSADTLTEDFRKGIGYIGDDRNVIKREFSIALKDGAVRWDTTSTLANGIQERISRGSIHEGMLTVFFPSASPAVVVATAPRTMADIPIAEYNPMSDAFSFLTPDKWKYGISPLVTLQDLHSSERWADAFRRLVSASVETFDSQHCLRLTFTIEDKSRFVVLFSKEKNYMPIHWQYYNNLGFLTSETTVHHGNFLEVSKGQNVFLPKTLTVKTYLGNSAKSFCANIREQECLSVLINGDMGDDFFVIDPALGDEIYDRDHDKWITVPK